MGWSPRYVVATFGWSSSPWFNIVAQTFRLHRTLQNLGHMSQKASTFSEHPMNRIAWMLGCPSTHFLAGCYWPTRAHSCIGEEVSRCACPSGPCPPVTVTGQGKCNYVYVYVCSFDVQEYLHVLHVHVYTCHMCASKYEFTYIVYIYIIRTNAYKCCPRFYLWKHKKNVSTSECKTIWKTCAYAHTHFMYHYLYSIQSKQHMLCVYKYVSVWVYTEAIDMFFLCIYINKV